MKISHSSEQSEKALIQVPKEEIKNPTSIFNNSDSDSDSVIEEVLHENLD